MLYRHLLLLVIGLTVAALDCASASKQREILDPAPEGSFSIVVIPDTQKYYSAGEPAKRDSSEQMTNPVFDAHTNWIVANVKAQRIAFVSHVGDVVDYNNDAQWRVARRIMDRLHGVVPYGLVPGNHDIGSGGSSALFQKYFPSTRFEHFDWYGESYVADPKDPYRSGNNANSYQLFSAEGLRFIFLHLECNAPDAVLQWAFDVAAAHRDRWLLVTTHLGPIQKKSQSKPFRRDLWGRMNWKKRHGLKGNTPQQMWEKFYREQENLLTIFSGDQRRTTTLYQADMTDYGNRVHALLSDYTSSGPLRIYRFLPKENLIRVFTYDTTKGELVFTSRHVAERDRHQFTIKHDLDRSPAASLAQEPLLSPQQRLYRGFRLPTSIDAVP